MKPGFRFVIGLAIAAVLVAGVVFVARGDAGEAPEACCFTNPAYTGVCRVVPAQGETCESILEYLNTPNSTGKDYCGNTHIRGGWKLVDCPGG